MTATKKNHPLTMLRQLGKRVLPSDRKAPSTHEYTIDELARQADTTVRNVRAYQDRGLLPPQKKRGRTGI